jgi:hypothetical protein
MALGADRLEPFRLNPLQDARWLKAGCRAVNGGPQWELLDLRVDWRAGLAAGPFAVT